MVSLDEVKVHTKILKASTKYMHIAYRITGNIGQKYISHFGGFGLSWVLGNSRLQFCWLASSGYNFTVSLGYNYIHSHRYCVTIFHFNFPMKFLKHSDDILFDS